MLKEPYNKFGVVLAKSWGIVKQPARSWHLDRVHTIVMACILLQNMIIEDDREEEHEDFWMDASPSVVVQRGRMPWRDFLAVTRDVEGANNWNTLKNDLIEKLWKFRADISQNY